MLSEARKAFPTGISGLCALVGRDEAETEKGLRPGSRNPFFDGHPQRNRTKGTRRLGLKEVDEIFRDNGVSCFLHQSKSSA